MTHKPDLAALVGSRICHDLISPVGAISNGMELIELSGAASAPELSLISESVQNANAKIRFFRVAFGQASANQQVGEQEILTILDNVAIGARMMVDWTVQGHVERAELRMAFLAILCFESALPFGGVVSVQHENGKWQLIGESEKLRVDETLWSALESGNPPEDLAPNKVQFGLLPHAAAQLGRKVSTSQTETRLELSF
ncbi:histidine phosphotransferase ChpT [Shimia isoporae]|uniref:Histidine phosphotransferase ChpT n=1 Tax=Shimia isoporae TaxID=647720 RepID=A0A4R1NMP9_9RHOB|nr:histidine phosphotransferase family protein [Shimia isoporae]TCL09455.1 histidine phosphotransferase ChpT [Shimia isoporae]